MSTLPRTPVTPGPETVAALSNLALRLREQPESLVACGTLRETIEQVLAEVGVGLFAGAAGEETDISTDSVWLGVVLAPDVVGVTIIDSTAERDWSDNSGPGPDMAHHRAAIVAQTLRSLSTPDVAMSGLLATPYADDFALDVAFRSMVLAAWWDTRMAEGQTPESARFLLSLTAHPALAAAVSFDSDGTPALPLPD